MGEIGPHRGMTTQKDQEEHGITVPGEHRISRAPLLTPTGRLVAVVLFGLLASAPVCAVSYDIVQHAAHPAAFITPPDPDTQSPDPRIDRLEQQEQRNATLIDEALHAHEEHRSDCVCINSTTKAKIYYGYEGSRCGFLEITNSEKQLGNDWSCKSQ